MHDQISNWLSTYHSRKTPQTRIARFIIQAFTVILTGSSLLLSAPAMAADLNHPRHLSAVAVQGSRPIKSVSPSSSVIGPWSFSVRPEGNELRVSIRYFGLHTVQKCTFRSTDPMFTRLLNLFDGTVARNYMVGVSAPYAGSQLTLRVDWIEKGKKQHITFNCKVNR